MTQLEKYFGVPYHPSYHRDPSSPHHNAPLFLDCCGLIRRVCQDLVEDFGFLIGPGNQAYQFETCPVEVEEKDLKPGDLVFTAGTYFKEGKKPQKHNMVHVEIFIGGGESGMRTIGARRQRGVVEIHDSYKYTSKSYTVEKQYLRSLDTWLSGDCTPKLDPNYWALKFKTSSKHSDGTPDGRSVFDACDDDLDEEEFQKEEGAKYFYVNKSNGHQLVTAAMEKRGYTRLPFEYSFSTSFDLKWVEGRSAINYFKHVDGQFVNHIPNNDVITNKIGLLTVLQDGYGQAFPPKYFPMTYRLDRPCDVLNLLDKIDDGSVEGKYWIHKPAGKNCGKGIRVVGVDEVKEMLTKKEGAGEEESEAAGAEEGNKNTFGTVEEASEAAINSRYSNLNLEKGLVQSYLTEPLLLEGKKFDIRCYGLISRLSGPDGGTFYYHKGYVRRSIVNFDMGEDKVGDNFVHLTNAAIQKKHPDYKDKFEETIWSMNRLVEYLVAQGKYESVTEGLKDIDEKLITVMNDVYKLALPKFHKKKGFFDLLGFDFMLTADLDPVLLEVNTNPALHLDCKVMEDVIPKVVDGTVGLVLAGQQDEASWKKKTGKDCLEEVGGEWTLVNNTLGGSTFDWDNRFAAGSSVEAVRKAKEGATG